MLIKVETLSGAELRERGVEQWPLRSHDIARIEVHYARTTVCYVVEGRARIETEDGNVEVEGGDLITLPLGLDCTWQLRTAVRTREQPSAAGNGSSEAAGEPGASP